MECTSRKSGHMHINMVMYLYFSMFMNYVLVAIRGNAVKTTRGRNRNNGEQMENAAHKVTQSFEIMKKAF